MSQYIDSYYLIENRKKSLIEKFINKYLLDYKESSEDYPIPLYSDIPDKTFLNLKDILDYLEENVKCEYSIYLENIAKNTIIKHFMVFFTDDSKMIFGISINGKEPNDTISINLFKELSVFLNSEIGCITVEEVPPANSNEFIEFCKKRYNPNR